MLIAANLTKSFNDFQAVDDVSFQISAQEIFGLLGPNGAGKTTTIRILSTILPPDGGDVSIGGYSVAADGDEVRKLIGVCPQELALYPELSAADNLIFFGRMAGLSGRDAKSAAQENLERVGLQDRARDKVDDFSGGMKRRVNLAIALMGRPKLLFLDEPTVGIDPQSRNHIIRDRRRTPRLRHDRPLHNPLHGRSRPPMRPPSHHGQRTHNQTGNPQRPKIPIRRPIPNNPRNRIPRTNRPQPKRLARAKPLPPSRGKAGMGVKTRRGVPCGRPPRQRNHNTYIPFAPSR